MRAVLHTRYGPPAEVLRVAEVDTPRADPGEVLVRVRATSVHADVWHVVAGFPLVLRLMGAGLGAPSSRSRAPIWPAPWRPWARG